MDTSHENFCWATFNALFIRASGHAFPCCGYQGPDVCVGNIHTDSVDDILHGASAMMNRKLSASLQLSCSHCSFRPKSYNPDGATLSAKDIFSWNEKSLRKLQFEIGYFCNSRCSFCDQPHLRKDSLPLDKIKEIISRCEPEEIQLQGGEFYYNEGAVDFLSWLAEHKGAAKIMMHTNCVIPPKKAELFVESMDFLSLNLYGGSAGTFEAVTGLKFEKAIAFIEELVAVRDRKGRSKDLTLALKMTTTPTTFHEIPDVILLADRLGVDNVRFSFDFKTVSSFLEKTENEFIARVWDRTNDAIDQVSVPVETKELVARGFERGRKVAKEVGEKMEPVRWRQYNNMDLATAQHLLKFVS